MSSDAVSLSKSGLHNLISTAYFDKPAIDINGGQMASSATVYINGQYSGEISPKKGNVILTENNTIVVSSEDSTKFNNMQYVRLDGCSITGNNGEYLISRISDAYKLKDCRNSSASDDCTETYTTSCNVSMVFVLLAMVILAKAKLITEI